VIGIAVSREEAENKSLQRLENTHGWSGLGRAGVMGVHSVPGQAIQEVDYKSFESEQEKWELRSGMFFTHAFRGKVVFT
jgi:hypothetical protein